ncbi:hypothetical protein [Asticcacaulis solisilvae]|uniref:hypothetical protein n=1 Tax=Asticcacaulis solisilvae TaxID=1217274 RepID=UPI003FD6DBF4
MIICPTFVFLHLHKSGGTFVNHMMMTCIPKATRVGYHLPYSEIPEAFQALPVLGTVRNPWSYYVSWFHFQQGQAKPNPLFRVSSQDGSLDFSATIRNLATLGDDNARIDRLKDAFPDTFVSHGLNLTKACIETIRGSGRGFYTFLYDRLYAGAQAPKILQMETLRRDLPANLPGLRGPERMLVRDFLQSVPDLNTSEHRPYRDYYDADLRDLVARMDAPVIDAHGYAY